MRLDAIPESVKKTLETLENNGFEAYLVGGCVRDMIMNRAVHDYDITTNALPEEVIASFPDNGKVTDGIRHGTVGIIWGKTVNEITTYRVDGKYSDARHPDGVFFTKSLKEDLLRRDFTVNAIACDLSGNIFDPCGGEKDIENKLLRAVGDPGKRFSEDALRIMRALRFSSVLGFEIEKETLFSMREKKELLSLIAPERIYSEMTKLLTGRFAANALREADILPFGIVPECEPFEKRTDAEAADVPLSYALFLGNEKEKAESFFKSLRADKKTAREALKTLKTPLPEDETAMRFCLSENEIDAVRRVISYNYLKGKIASREPYVALLSSAGEKCCKIKDLRVTGRDIINAGLSGEKVGEALSFLLREVILGRVKNEKTSLTAHLEGKFTHI